MSTKMSETLGTIERVLSLLTVIAESERALGVKDVSDALQLPMSTSHRLLDLLLEAGFVEKDQAKRRYAVGLEFLRLASLVTQKTSYPALVQPILDQITAKSGETSIYTTYLPAPRAVMYAAKSDSPDSLRFRITLFQQTPLEWGASSLAILAFLPAGIQEEVFANPSPSLTARKRLSRSAFFQRIETVQRTGFAFTESEKLQDSVGIAAPVMISEVNVVGSIALTIPKVRFIQSKLASYATIVKQAANGVSRRLNAK
jgi:DNA-binding IclR family transcriptional regulator